MRTCPHCGKTLGKVTRISVTVPPELAAYVRRLAAQRGTTISAVVTEAIQLYRDSERVAA